MSTAITAEDEARQELTGFGGKLIGPADPGYDEARVLFNAMFDKHPALIAQCASADDVAAAIGFARRHDLPVAIHGGGHNGAGLGSVDDGVVVDMRLLRDVSVDAGSRAVRVGGGC